MNIKKSNSLQKKLAWEASFQLGGLKIDKRTHESKDLILRMKNIGNQIYDLPIEYFSIRIKDLNHLRNLNLN